MSDTNYPGIDYGMGQTNIDLDTGIRYGVIPMNTLNEWAWESFEPDYGNPHCPHCGNEACDSSDEGVPDFDENEDIEVSGCGDYYCAGCRKAFDGDEAFGDEAIGHNLDDGEYQGFVDSYNDVMLLKSPFYTRAQFCSPCAPGAAYLTNPCDDGPKAYCFGHDWFDGGIAPYPVYRVSDDTLVQPE